jgi:hypothetical protein
MYFYMSFELDLENLLLFKIENFKKLFFFFFIIINFFFSL